MSSSTNETSGNFGFIWNGLWSFFTSFSWRSEDQTAEVAHKILGLDPSVRATQKEIDKQYRVNMRQCHPGCNDSEYMRERV